uniref:Hypothetical secreted peptide 1191 n=1 Tax=Amblyomma variegatum TaxID=34610 RepID=F0J9T7_AMBVA|nr:TPA_inf: hypothetical secreted peptide precursor 1191 [Amblyomma variegatum]
MPSAIALLSGAVYLGVGRLRSRRQHAPVERSEQRHGRSGAALPQVPRSSRRPLPRRRR